jgi:phage tail-like protein
MPDARINDLLQTHRFWLIDVVPSSVIPFFVLGSPLYGFSGISAPSIELSTRDVRQMNSMWTDTVYEGGSAGSITLSRGVRANDNSFFEWVKRAMRGGDQVHRTLMLIHYTGMAAETPDLPVPLDAWEGVVSVPGRLWMLWKCLPVMYKSGSDFDAKSGDISIMEIEIKPRAIEEIVLMPSNMEMLAGSALGTLSPLSSIIK